MIDCRVLLRMQAMVMGMPPHPCGTDRSGSRDPAKARQVLDAAVQPLLTALNETRTLYPGTNLRLVDEFVSATASGEPAAAPPAAA